MDPMGRCVAQADKVDSSLPFNFERGLRLGGAHGEISSPWREGVAKSKCLAAP